MRAAPLRTSLTRNLVCWHRKLAFVLGINKYLAEKLRLRNCVPDAKAVAKHLESMGFEVMLVIDLTLTEFIKKLSEFRKLVKG
jgi:hypothetical protein